MDEGKSAGPRAKWWSRPEPGRPGSQADPARAADGPTGAGDGGNRVDGDAGDTQADRPDLQGPAGHYPDTTPAPPRDIPPEPHDAPAPVAPAPAAPVQERPKPLHDPDPYGTPPYGGPGPWAPAPPVQRPTPAHGTQVPPPQPTQGHGGQVPPPHAQSGGQGAPAAPQFSAPHPHHVPAHQPPQQHPQPPQQPQPHQHGQPQPYPPSQWLSYDPWSAAPQQPLTFAVPAPKKRGRGGLLVGALLIALLAGGIGGGVGAYIERNNGLNNPVKLPQASKAAGDRAPDTVAGIAASALPSVVTFHVSGPSGKGTGTGFVLDNQGHILTNNHVVEPAGTSGVISITFSSGETAKAKLVGKDGGYDLAVVKVSGVSGLKPLPLGNSDNVRVGDPVVAIGAPFDLQNTVTAGIISAKQRPITAGGEKGDGSDVSYVDALQTDAPINPGNSGGPLVDAQARVIGVNSAIRGPDSGGGLEGGQGGSIGLGFAIPINQAKRVAEEIINTGKATHPVIGVSLDMKFTGDGAQVGDKGADNTPSVTPGGPGAKAGIKPGDVITKVDGQRVHSGEELIVKIRSRKPGELLRMTVRRDGTDREVSLTLGSAGDS
ncbi:trypsin-like peptidase domain-containing protein [Streptomyces sp. NPDC051561]|uniref:trypsin-like peptidase domain-containing protein n=1 Tax=Streptomyces sp. NPDC051561 TaxID=3365658 RepID=UPI0037AE5E44